MKKKSLGQIYLEARGRAVRKKGFCAAHWSDLTPTEKKLIEAGCAAVARKVRERDRAKENLHGLTNKEDVRFSYLVSKECESTITLPELEELERLQTKRRLG
jgi:hypothetical protein